MDQGADDNHWMPASHALRAASRYFEAEFGLDGKSAQQRAVAALIEQLATGRLSASPKGFLPQYAGHDTELRRWYWLRLVEEGGKETDYQAVTKPDSDFVVIPVEFWLPFQRGDGGASADWSVGDFKLAACGDPEGAWSGWARDVHFDSIDLPAVWSAVVDDGEAATDAAKGILPARATQSDREHEDAAHAAAEIVRTARCSLEQALAKVRHLVEEKNRQEASINRAIRRSYRLMYDPHGLPIKN